MLISTYISDGPTFLVLGFHEYSPDILPGRVIIRRSRMFRLGLCEFRLCSNIIGIGVKKTHLFHVSS